MKRLLTFIALTWATCGGIYLSAQETAKPVSSPAGAGLRADGGTPVVPGTASKVKALPGEAVELRAKTTPVAAGGFAVVKIVGLSPAEAADIAVTPDPVEIEYIEGGVHFSGLAKEYKVEAVIVNFETRKIYRKRLVVPFTQTGKPPVTEPPVTDPPTTPTGKYYFMIVRPDGPASPAFTQAMSLPAWEELSKAGHQYKDKTVTEAAALGYTLPPGTTLPMVVTLEIVGNVSKVVRGPVPFPTTPGGIADLPKGIK